MKKYISDQIDKQEISKWTPEQPVVITAGTGSGKSYFILNTLLKHAEENNERILLLLPRVTIKEQFMNELAIDSNNIVIETYQWLEKRSLRDKDDMQFDYIVSDESHYFVHESSFNKNTWHSWQWIMRQEDSVRLFLSATPKLLLPLLKNKNKKEYNYETTVDNISEVQFFPIYEGNKRYDFIREKLQELLLTDEKAIVFMGSIVQGAELYREFKSRSMFLCSESQKDYLHLMNDLQLEHLLETESFEEQILFTTSVLEFGVTIKDPNVKHIFYDGYYEDSMIQSVGRKRKETNDDKATLYLAEPSKRALNGTLQSATRDVEPLKRFFNKDNEIIYSMIQEGYSALEDVNLRGVSLRANSDKGIELDINPLTYIKLQNTIVETKELLDIIEKGHYYRVCAKRFNKDSWTIPKEDEKVSYVNQCLKDTMGSRLYTKEERDKLSKQLDLRNETNDRLLKSNTKINEVLVEMNIPYRIVAKRDYARRIEQFDGESSYTCENPYYKKTYWEVQNLDAVKENK